MLVDTVDLLSRTTDRSTTITRATRHFGTTLRTLSAVAVVERVVPACRVTWHTCGATRSPHTARCVLPVVDWTSSIPGRCYEPGETCNGLRELCFCASLLARGIARFFRASLEHARSRGWRDVLRFSSTWRYTVNGTRRSYVLVTFVGV